MELIEEKLDEHHLDQGEVVDVVVRFAGDSGDGMQLTGSNFTLATALYGNDLSTFPDFPAEIRAPVGATFGVSAFQIYFGSDDIVTAGDAIDVLVAMNPAALITNLENVIDGGLIIVDRGAFSARTWPRPAMRSIRSTMDPWLNSGCSISTSRPRFSPPWNRSDSATRPACDARTCGPWA